MNRSPRRWACALLRGRRSEQWDAYTQGLIEVQDSRQPADHRIALRVAQDDTVIDLCAAWPARLCAGGKGLAIRQALSLPIPTSGGSAIWARGPSGRGGNRPDFVLLDPTREMRALGN